MNDPFLAPAESQRGIATFKDVFASPPMSSSISDSPTRPPPALQKAGRIHSGSTVASHAASDTLHGSLASEPATLVEKFGSMSSGEKSILSPYQSVESNTKRSSRGSKCKRQSRNSRDVEKGILSPRGSGQHYRHYGSPRRHHLYKDDQEETQRLQESKAVRILLFLAGPCVALSVLNALWALISVVITLLSQPVRLCAQRPSFGQQVGGLLGPSLNLQLKCIYTPLPPFADEDASYHPMTLVTVQLLSPFLSLGVMIAAWVVAAFWVSSLVVGDPAGTDRRDDGNETVQGLRKFWEKWLYRSIRED